MRPLFDIENLWRAQYEAEFSDYEIEKEKADLVIEAWRQSFKTASRKGDSEPARPDRSINPPIQHRLILQDATFEKLHEILSENPAGVLVQRDELAGWLAQLDRQGREGERAFYLSAWNGTTGHSIERIGRGSIYVAACCVSLFGSIQPARLRTYLQDALQDGPSNDGLMQRFQILVWPDSPTHWELIDRAPDAKAREQARRVLERLAGLSVDEPKLLKFSPEAQELFDAWLTELEQGRLRSDSFHPAMVAHLAKYRSLMPVLAALFELADWAAGLGGGDEISIDHSKQSAACCEYLESHAHRVYSCVVSP
jgi:putative DNA primase/helicase